MFGLRPRLQKLDAMADGLLAGRRRDQGIAEFLEHVNHRVSRNASILQQLETNPICASLGVRFLTAAVETDNASQVAVGQKVAHLVGNSRSKFIIAEQVHQPASHEDISVGPAVSANALGIQDMDRGKYAE